MSVRGVTAKALATETGTVPAGRWRAWRARFGLAELCGTVAGIGGFTAGYIAAGSLLPAAGRPSAKPSGFTDASGPRQRLRPARVTAHLAGWRRLAAGTWHAITGQLASCAAAEALDGFLVRPGCLAGAAWLAEPLPGGVWLGFAAGKIAADIAWYGMEASARHGVIRARTARRVGTPARHGPEGGC